MFGRKVVTAAPGSPAAAGSRKLQESLQDQPPSPNSQEANRDTTKRVTEPDLDPGPAHPHVDCRAPSSLRPPRPHSRIQHLPSSFSLKMSNLYETDGGTAAAAPGAFLSPRHPESRRRRRSMPAWSHLTAVQKCRLERCQLCWPPGGVPKRAPQDDCFPAGSGTTAVSSGCTESLALQDAPRSWVQAQGPVLGLVSGSGSGSGFRLWV